MPDRQDPARNFGFIMEIHGKRAGYFSRISQLGLEIESIEYREGGMPSTVHKLPGRTKVHDIVVEHGVTQSDDLWQWLDRAVQGHVERRNISIVLLAPNGKDEVARFNCNNSWVKSCEIEELCATGNAVLIARMCIAAETLERGPNAAAEK